MRNWKLRARRGANKSRRTSVYANDADDPSWGTQKVAFVPVLQRRRDGNVPGRKA